MSDTPIVNPQGEPIEEQAPEIEDVPQEPEALDLSNLQCGYVVGLGDNGEFVFEVLGGNPGLVQLLGLHQYADHRLTYARDVNQNYGYPVMMKQINQIGQMMQVLLNMLTQQSKSGIVPGK